MIPMLRAVSSAEADGDAAKANDRPATPNFLWPTPPFAACPRDIEQTEAEDCEFESRPGRGIKGKLIFFLPSENAFEFQLPRARTTQTIRFDEIRLMRLPRPLLLRREAELAGLGGEVALTSEKRRYSIELAGGERIEGYTLGIVRESFGLFLFPCSGEATEDPIRIQRLFIPHQAVRDVALGDYIGQLLVAERMAEPNQIEEALTRQHEMRTQRIGDYLVANNIVTEDQLVQAIKRQESMPVLRLGEALIEMGLVTSTQLEEALSLQKENRSRLLGRILVEMGVIGDGDLQLVLARKLGFPLVDLTRFPHDPEATKLVSQSTARRLRMMPLLVHDGMLVVALEDPLRTDKLNEVRFMTQLKVVPVIARRDQIELAIKRGYAETGVAWHETRRSEVESAGENADAADPGLPFTAAMEASGHDINDLAHALDLQPLSSEPEESVIQESDNTLVRLVNTMILDACSRGASDIHIESYPDRQKMRVRFRQDGTLVPYLELPSSYRAAVLARIKIMADLDISERRKPQDGKIDFQRFGPARIELRVATVPTARNLEDAVLRILSSARPVPLANLGLSDYNLDHIRKIMTKAYGMFLICGPTGSGKTTTLHSALSYINVPERKIWTAEDPVEITQPGLRQVQVNPKIGWTFAAALRSFLRADPDVIMVGEMRDSETAKTGVEASLTGHLVLSTLHTNSAPESIVRLLDMGLDPFNFADALLGVLAQRLTKRLCPACRKQRVATEEELTELLDDYCYGMFGDGPAGRDGVRRQWLGRHGSENGSIKLCASEGCSECGGTGYRGRIGLHELLVATPQIKRLAQTGGRIEEIRRVALEQGMRTLKQDGIEKILRGETDLVQVRAVTN